MVSIGKNGAKEHYGRDFIGLQKDDCVDNLVHGQKVSTGLVAQISTRNAPYSVYNGHSNTSLTLSKA